MDGRVTDDPDIHGFPVGEVDAAEHFVEEPDRMVRGKAVIEGGSEERNLKPIQRRRGPMRYSQPLCRSSYRIYEIANLSKIYSR
jgi:hypothetical protein